MHANNREEGKDLPPVTETKITIPSKIVLITEEPSLLWPTSKDSKYWFEQVLHEIILRNELKTFGTIPSEDTLGCMSLL